MPKRSHIDSKKIEKIAVRAIDNLIQPCPTLDCKLNVDDKNILVDGIIELYKNEELTKANLLGIIDVQVKGSTSKLKPNKHGKVKYQIDIEDLTKYLNVYHGVLFLCVSVVNKGGRILGEDVFYAQLLPYDIAQIMADAKPNQKSKSVPLKPFPTSEREITRLLSTFHADREKQLKSVVSAYGFSNSDKELPAEIKSISFSASYLPDERSTSFSAFQNGVYLYAKTIHEQSLVVGKIDNISRLIMSRKATVKAGHFELKTQIHKEESENEQCLTIEGIRFTMRDDETKLSYETSGDFHRRYNTAKLAFEFIKSGQLCIDNKPVVHLEPDENTKAQLNSLSKVINACEPIIETLDELSISASWDPAALTDKELNTLLWVRSLLIDNEALRKRKLKSPLIHFDIKDSCIYALANEREDGFYQLYDLFSTETPVVLGFSNEEAPNSDRPFDPVPPFSVLETEDYKRIVNISPANFRESFVRFPITKQNEFNLNDQLLKMLEAFDNGCQSPNALLTCAIVLARMLHKFDAASEYYFLNLAQALKRKQKLNVDDKNRLTDIAIESRAMPSKAAAHALLDDMNMASKCMERCTESERKQLLTHPIAHFLPKPSN